MSELVEGVEVVEIMDTGDWLCRARDTGEFDRGVELGVESTHPPIAPCE